MLRHLAFFDELAGLDEERPAWHEVTAGLVVLRLVDSCFAEGVPAPEDAYRMSAVARAIHEIADGRPCRAVLRSIVDSMATSVAPDAHVVNPRLIAYGQLLEYESAWALAADVYQSILRHTDPLDDSDSAILAQIRLGFCLWTLNRLDEADHAYGMAGEIATRVGDVVGVLRSRLGTAKVATIRGNLPGAEAILDAAISQASAPELRGVQSMLFHDRSYLAHLRGDHELAIRLAYRAFQGADSARARDRLLGDIAISFLNLGVRSAARNAYLVLAGTAQEQYVRWNANVALMFIAAQDGLEPIFAKYRRELEDDALPPLLATEFALRVGESYKLLDQIDAARNWTNRAIELAYEHELNQLAFEAEAQLGRLSCEEPRIAPITISVTGEVHEIAGVMRAMRQRATMRGG
jgi:tetratricopeptide (TPR) repeat protein